MLRGLAPHMQLSKAAQRVWGEGVTALLCFTCRAAAFCSAFPEPPLHLPIINIKTHTLLMAVIKIRGVFVLCQLRGFLCPGAQLLSPLAVVQGLPSAPVGAGSRPRTAVAAKSRAAAYSPRENPIPGQNPGQLQQSHTSTPFGDLHRGTKMSCTLI